METTTPQPFTNMAISLSGGGYRATTFHLGALSYLHVSEYKGDNLLQQVRVLSTISGGTLTGILYALYAATDRSFDDCYDKLYKLLKADKLLEKAFAKLNHPEGWLDPYKSKDVINAFAEVYHSDFFEGQHFKVLFDSSSTHLSDVIFGATEFTTGKQFRFTQNRGNGKFGNFDLHLPDAVAAQVRLADAAAASSCFPGGFEPIVMAKDFANQPDGLIATAWENAGYPPTGIMDGGIIDNQGIEGVQLAEERLYKIDHRPYIGTYIISDVSSRDMEPYEVPIFKNNWFSNLLTFRRVNWVVGIAMAVVLGFLVFAKMPVFCTCLSASLLTLGIAWFIVFLLLRNSIVQGLDNMIGKKEEPRLFNSMKVIFKTPIYILFYLLKFRATSVLKMVMDVFMKRIRTLQLDALFGHEDWNYRIETNNIYTLYGDEVAVQKRLQKLGFGPMSKAMKEVVDTANSMPTTLWFSTKHLQENMLDKLIACGQFTLCFKLIDYIENVVKKRKIVWDSLDDSTKAEIEAFCLRLKTDFIHFNDDPLYMVRRFAPASKVEP